MAQSNPMKKVAEIMTRNPICASAADSVAELARMMDDNGISGVPVTDTQNRLIGVVSKTDLIHRCLEGPIGSRGGRGFWEGLREGTFTGNDLDPNDLGRAEDFMTTDPVTAQSHEDIGTVARRMARDRVHRVVVVEDESVVVGMVTTLDLLALFPE